MASYSEWNEALIVYFTVSASRGSEVYLSVDGNFRHVAESLGLSINQTQNAMDDFRAAVQAEVICDSQVCLDSIRGHAPGGTPKCVAFLGAMVLAAARMGNSQEASSSAYFIHLRDVLGLPPAQKHSNHRPVGLPTGVEERFWLDWNHWLKNKGLRATATHGSGLNVFIHYAQSQCLLRKADRDRLHDLFADSNWPSHLSPQEVVTRLRWRDYNLTSHLREVLCDRRAEAATDFIYDIFEEGILEELRQNVRSSSPRKNGITPTTLTVGRPMKAELLRRESWVSDGVEYHLLPRRQPHRRADKVRATVEGQAVDLRVDEARQRWFEPIGPLSVAAISGGATFPIAPPNFYGEIVLRRNEFWVLVPDAEDSGDLASWGAPQYGRRFVLLIRDKLVQTLEEVRGNLLEWEGEPQQVIGLSGWVELRECAVVGDTWDEARDAGVSEELLEALRPQQRLSIGLSGGLRAGRSGWCQNQGPCITVFGVPTSLGSLPRDEVEVTIYRAASDGDEEIANRVQHLNEPHAMTWPEAGAFRVEASFRGSETTALVFIRSWDEVRAGDEPSNTLLGPQWGKWRLCGAKHEEMSAPWAKEAQHV